MCPSGAKADLSNRKMQQWVIHLYREASSHVASPIGIRLIASMNWTLFSKHVFGGKSLLEAAQTRLALLDAAVACSSSLGNQYHRLSRLSDRAGIEAATFAISRHDLRSAVTLLEQGRALIFAQLGRYRSVLGKLEGKHADLATRFGTISRELNNLVVRDVDNQYWSLPERVQAAEEPAARHVDCFCFSTLILTHVDGCVSGTFVCRPNGRTSSTTSAQNQGLNSFFGLGTSSSCNRPQKAAQLFS